MKPSDVGSVVTICKRSFCAGYLDAGLKLLNSLTAPSISGDVRISRGVASLMPGGPSAPGSGSGGSGASAQPGNELAEMRARARENDLVLKAFTVLTRKDALARQISRMDMQQVGPDMSFLACLKGHCPLGLSDAAEICNSLHHQNCAAIEGTWDGFRGIKY